jgi:hypothetical protein
MDTSRPQHDTVDTNNTHQPREIRKSQVSLGRQWLIETMQRLGYGQIKQLIVVNREPVAKPPPKICPRRNLVGRRYRSGKVLAGDFILKEHVTNLFEEFDAMGNGAITIDVRDGLPFDIQDE